MNYLLILLLFFINPFFCNASLVLNEIYPAASSGESEWVELYNDGYQSIDISQYQLLDEGDRKINISTGSAPPFGFILATSVGVLNNDKDTVKLKNNLGETIDIATYSGNFSSSKTLTYAKCPNGGTNWFILDMPTKNSSNEFACQTLTPTPTYPTETPSPSTEQRSLFPTITLPQPTSDSIPEVNYQNILISEVYPYPQSNEHEWIEFYNDNDIQVDLVHWYIDDAENTGSAPKSFSLKIDPYTYAVVDLSSSLFNNSGDVARLLDSNKNEKDSMEYGKITQGNSIGRISFEEDSYCEQEPSKNTANSSCLSEPTQTVSSQSTQNTVKSTQKSISPTKKTVNQPPQQTNTGTNLMRTTSPKQEGEILGVQTKEIPYTSPTPYLSSVSFSYSLLTIVSIFIKMKNA
ncbi:hypothetical protein COW57_01440 [Candidatus Roizmanbacteria bacterium CG17_big_fil_post_rev_8_21_14_2_50_39_7]|uniref:LTD domain-containing protein n=2 Tax=Candidatus Roizmaniibacteriota TaxID=1752723 RepID=A0A2M7EKM1_9BACT|nr:MAG: hypothetical protein COS52_00235 [Candidatus Roizmanbacteria bacterium CG03_land_8_20_14_0_80_39_12]PIV71103.1 MAG: hypothetical protein COW57_01440 [Candidatus Roizmanbacteria bacterium CG17_big_fil_post_rev_8_21_14_2_50_39_7]